MNELFSRNLYQNLTKFFGIQAYILRILKVVPGLVSLDFWFKENCSLFCWTVCQYFLPSQAGQFSKPINPVVLIKILALFIKSRVVLIFENEVFLMNDDLSVGLYGKYQCFSKWLVFHFLSSHGDLVTFTTIIPSHWKVHGTGYRQSPFLMTQGLSLLFH